MTDHVIGDTVQLGATIKDFAGVEKAPSVITVSVQKLDGTVLLSSTGTAPALVSTGVTAQYYKDWTIAGTTGVGGELISDERLACIWEWTSTGGDPHTKKSLFNVIPIL